MKQIRYTGTSNIRHLGSEDFAKMGLEDFGPITFYGRQPQEFKNETAKVLLEHGLVAGEFEEVEPEAKDEKSVPEAKSASTRDASRKGTDQS